MHFFYIQGFRKFSYGEYLRNNLDLVAEKNRLVVLDLFNLIGKKRRSVFNVTNVDQDKFPRNLNIITFTSSLKLFIFLLNVPKKSVFICEGVSKVNLTSYLIFMILRLKKTKIIIPGFTVGFFRFADIPSKNINKNTPLLKIFKIFLSRIINIFDTTLVKFFFTNVDYYVYSGELNRDINNVFLNNFTKKISTLSHELRQLKKKNKTELDFNYAVFLDQSVGNHPETIGNHGSEYTDYYKKLDTLFKYYEKKENIKIVIAGHPLIKNNFFSKRKIIYNNTAELVRNSKFVIAVTSSSIVYPIFLKKKILLIKSNLFNKIETINDDMVALSKLTNLQYYNIDEFETNKPKLLLIDNKLRKKVIKYFGIDFKNFTINPYNKLI